MVEKSGTSGTKKQLMNDTVHQALRVMIAERRFKPGQRLNVEELARELKVSRTPVWEAIRRLEQDGIVRNEPNRGVFMADNPLESIRDRLQVRGALDRLAGQLACTRIDRRTIERLQKCLPDQLHGIETADVRTYLEADIRFHRLICEASGNVVLKNLYASITAHVFPTSFNLLASLSDLYLVHQEIINALSDNDRQRVDSAFVRHNTLLVAYLEDQMHAEATHKELVRRIKASSAAANVSRGRKPRQPPRE